MLRFSGSSQNPGSSVLEELQLSNALLWKTGEETIIQRYEQVSPSLD